MDLDYAAVEPVAVAPAAPSQQRAIAEQFKKLGDAAHSLARLFDPSVPVAPPMKLKRKMKAEPGAPDKPKRAPTAYNMFVKEQMPLYLKEHPEVKAAQAMAVLAKSWKAGGAGGAVPVGDMAGHELDEAAVKKAKKAAADAAGAGGGEEKKKLKKLKKAAAAAAAGGAVDDGEGAEPVVSFFS